MKRVDVEKLLGGYAAGILTDEERQALLEAALEDQALFTELMREEPMRELLSDPVARVELRHALAPPAQVESAWHWWRPAAAGLLSAAFGIALLLVWRVPPEEQRIEMAVLQAPTPPDLAYEAPPPAPAPDAVQRKSPPPRPAPQAGRGEQPRTGVEDAAAVAGSVTGNAAGQKLVVPEFAFRPTAPAGRPAVEARRAAESMPQAEKTLTATPAPSGFRRAAPAPVRFTSEVRARERFYRGEEPGLRYAIMLRQPHGPFTEIPPESVLPATAEVRVSVEANAAGPLRVVDEQGAVIFERVTDVRERHFIAAPPDRQRLEITFASGSAEPEVLVTEAIATPAENAVYVVNPTGAGVRAVIPLKRDPVQPGR